MRFKNVFKDSLISLAVLGMIGGSININNVNASRRRYRTHRVYRHRARKVNYKFGYWKHHHYYRYKTGYFRNGKWIRKSYRHNAHRVNRRSHKVYHFMGRTYHNERDYDIALYNSAVFGNPDGAAKHHRNHRIKWNKHVNKKHFLTKSKYMKKRQAKKIHKAIKRSNPYKRKLVHKHYKIHKTYRTTSKSTQNNLKQIENRLINDINNDRQANGIPPLQISSKLTALAKLRAEQMIKTGVTHYNKQGQFYGTLDAPKVGLPSDFDCGENAGDSSLGTSTNEDGHTSTNRTINDIADNKDNNMMNYDAHSNWGHRKNILDPNYTVLGVGASYDPSTQDYYEVEDFNDTNPDYSTDNNVSSDTDNTVTNTSHHELPAGTVTDGNGNPISQAQQQHEHDKIQAETAKANAQYKLNWDQSDLNDTLRGINDYPANKRQQIISGPQNLVNKDKDKLQQAITTLNNLN